jgi:hypothetical protein
MGLVEWLKVKALSSSPSTAKKKKVFFLKDAQRYQWLRPVIFVTWQTKTGKFLCGN